MDKVKFGIIGCGNMGTSHARRIAAGEITNGVLTALCDNVPEKLDAIRAVYGDTVAYFSDAEEMLKAGVCDVSLSPRLTTIIRHLQFLLWIITHTASSKSLPAFIPCR